jgi:hypothetical protein
MLLADPEAALRDTRRILRPGGRITLAAWDEPGANAALSSMGRTFVEMGLSDPPDPDAPGPFSFAVPGRLQELLEAAGFADIEVSAVDFTFAFDSPDDYFDVQSDLSPTARAALANLSPADHTQFRDALDEKVKAFQKDDGSIEFPSRTLVAAASA